MQIVGAANCTITQAPGNCIKEYLTCRILCKAELLELCEMKAFQNHSLFSAKEFAVKSPIHSLV